MADKPPPDSREDDENGDDEEMPTEEAGQDDDDSDDIDEDDEENDNEDSDSDDEGDDKAEAEAEAAQEREIESLRRNLASNPYHYDSHVRLIELLRRSGDLDGSRAARERMHAQYPLSPQLWLDWVGDERRLLTDGEAASAEQAEAIDALFRRALNDYASVEVAVEYCVFAIGQQKLLQQQRQQVNDSQGGSSEKDDSSAVGGSSAESVRRVFEHCIALVGRFAGREDQRVWQAFRDFELLELARTEATAAVGAASAPAAEAAAAAVDRQRRRVLDVFRRHLGTPHLGLEDTWKELIDWLGGEKAPPGELLKVYERSCGELKEIETFEERLVGCDQQQSARIYREYIAAACGGPAQQLAVFERAVSANCLDAGLWQGYVAYVWEQFEPGPKLCRLCQRAVRNCPWSGHLWRQLALCQECAGADFAAEVRPTYEAAVTAGLADAADLLAVWTAYLDAARRHAAKQTGGDGSNESAWADWHALCERAVATMEAGFGAAGDPQASLLRYGALLRALGGELGPARQIWDMVMKRGHGNSSAMWLRQLEFELRFGDAKHVRRCLGRAVNSVSGGDECEQLLQRWIDYEREEGDLSAYVEAVKRAEKQRRLLQQRAEEQGGGGKRKAGVAEGGGGPAAKRAKPSAAGPSAGAAKRQHPRGAAAATAAGAPASAIGEGDAQQPRRQPGEFKKPLPPGAAASTQPTPPVQSAKVEHDPAKDYRTVFLSNLAYDVDEDGIRVALAPCSADITSLRLVRDYRGRSKGFAYVEFNSGAAANSARKLDRSLINGRPMFVSECRTGGKHPASSLPSFSSSSSSSAARDFQYDTGLERNKLFVRNLPRVMDQAAFETMCSGHPGYRAARLSVFRSGASKGLGYVEFADPEAAGKALIVMDGMEVGNCRLEVAISNPPARRERGEAAPQQRRSFAAAGGTDPLATDPNRHRTKVSLVPRQLHKAPGVDQASSPGSATASAQSAATLPGGGGGGRAKGMSNDDFRNLLMRK